MKVITGIFLVLFICFSVVFSNAQETVKDKDGNIYKTVKAGSQVWMAENLKVTHYLNGEAIPNITEPKQWDALTSGAWCDIGNDPVKAKTYGHFYNWYTIADQRNVCPQGWHVPSETEWIDLLTFLAGEKLSPFKTSAPIPVATKSINASLFQVLPEDFRGWDLESSHVGYGGGGWWTSTPVTEETAWLHGTNYDTAGKIRMEGRKKFGYCIRCIKD
jgi:uncharacterized protein (TIGR02145 family)